MQQTNEIKTQKNDIEIYLTYDEGKSVVAEKFIIHCYPKVTMYKCMNSVSKNVYNDKLDDIVNKYNNKYHRTIKMKPADVKWSTYFDFHKGNNNKRK